jgi:hypothetical protein
LRRVQDILSSNGPGTGSMITCSADFVSFYILVQHDYSLTNECTAGIASFSESFRKAVLLRMGPCV